MTERKIRIANGSNGAWIAVSGSKLEQLGGGLVRHDPFATVATAFSPWEASAAVYAALGEDIQIEWEALPWPTLREAHGIVGGVCELLGAGRDAKREIAKAKWKAAGRLWLCWRCREQAPTNAEEIGWGYGSDETPGEPGWDGWLCPPCRSDMPGAPASEPKRDGSKRKRRRGRS